MTESGRRYPGDIALEPDQREALGLRLHALISTLAAGVIETDVEGRCVYANPSALRILGVSKAELVGHTLAELGFERYDGSGAKAPFDASAEQPAHADQDGSHRTAIRVVRGTGVDVWLELQTAPLRSEAGEVVGTAVSFVDVTDRFRRQAAKRVGIERMNEVLRAMAAGVLMVDAEGRIEYANPAAAALSGLKPEDVIGQLAADPAWQLTDEHGVILPYDALPVPTALRERREVRGVELGVPTLSGVMRWMRVSAFPLFEPNGTLRGAVVTTEDVTERHTLAEQLLQAQKIEGIGQLAGGIAHDFNNLLTVILGNAELALRTAARKSFGAVEVSEIRDAANRGAALTRQLLTFARKQVVQPRAIYLDRLTDTIDKLLHRAIGEDIALQRVSDPSLWPVKVDPGQIEQVLVNMAINARDAMPRGGSLMITTRNTTLDAQHVQAHPGIEPGDFVTLSIGDTGIGMSRDLVTRIFEPFFTTKPTGSGTGLGLSICHGIVKQARGFISVDTAPDRGTTFHIHLPRTNHEAPESPAALDSPLAKARETILLVEDQDAVRSLVARVLAGYGYEVISAVSGRQALALHERMSRPLDLLLTDIVMPEMGGIELAAALQARVPGLPVLYMTGYFDLHGVDHAELNVDENLLLKPFTPMQLVERIQRLFARSARDRASSGPQRT